MKEHIGQSAGSFISLKSREKQIAKDHDEMIQNEKEQQQSKWDPTDEDDFDQGKDEFDDEESDYDGFRNQK